MQRPWQILCCRRRAKSNINAITEPRDHKNGAVARQLGQFEAACRASFPSEAALNRSVDEAMAFIHAICEGISTNEATAVVRNENGSEVLEVRPHVPVRGDFATRSRIPYTLHVEKTVSFRLMKTPDDLVSSCPFRCACHARCFGPASCMDSLPWAELAIAIPGVAGQRRPALERTYATTPQVFPVDESAMQGARLVHVPGNKMDAVDLRGAAAIVTEKNKPGDMSDAAVVRAAHAAGACCVIKIGGGGSLLYCVPEPVEIPSIAITEMDGHDLLNVLEYAKSAGQPQPQISWYSFHDRRKALEEIRRPGGSVWLCMEGLILQTIDYDAALSDVLRESRAGGGRADGAIIYEDYFSYFQRAKATEDRISPNRSKLRRIVESAWTQLGRFGLARNPAMMGKMLALASQRQRYKAEYMRFSPSSKGTGGVSCALMLVGEDSSGSHPESVSSPSAATVQAWAGHEAVYLATMGWFTRIIDWVAPSLWNLLKCTNGEFFGWEADSEKIVKLFSPAVGMFGPVPKETWQQEDPTWRIVDEKNVFGVVTKEQGRLVWTAAAQGGALKATREPLKQTGVRVRMKRSLQHLAICTGGCTRG